LLLWFTSASFAYLKTEILRIRTVAGLEMKDGGRNQGVCVRRTVELQNRTADF